MRMRHCFCGRNGNDVQKYRQQLGSRFERKHGIVLQKLQWNGCHNRETYCLEYHDRSDKQSLGIVIYLLRRDRLDEVLGESDMGRMKQIVAQRHSTGEHQLLWHDDQLVQESPSVY